MGAVDTSTAGVSVGADAVASASGAGAGAGAGVIAGIALCGTLVSQVGVKTGELIESFDRG